VIHRSPIDDLMSTRPSDASLAAYVLAVLVLAAAALTGIPAFFTQTSIALGAPHDVVPPEMNAAIRLMRANLPPDAPLFYIMDRPQPWLAGVWQRASYPNPVFFLDHPGTADLDLPANRQVRAQYNVRHALSVGDPPVLDCFAWYKMLPPVPGSFPAAYGELKPELKP
jgi:hypothetical protein